jgi:hypothetical protein
MMFKYFHRSDDPVDEVVPGGGRVVVSVQKPNLDYVIPLQLQPGFSLPGYTNDINRFFLAFGNIIYCLIILILILDSPFSLLTGTATYTSYTVTSTTSSLTAICNSITNFPVCGSGK